MGPAHCAADLVHGVEDDLAISLAAAAMRANGVRGEGTERTSFLTLLVRSAIVLDHLVLIR
jgi:hypothetical protein